MDGHQINRHRWHLWMPPPPDDKNTIFAIKPTQQCSIYIYLYKIYIFVKENTDRGELRHHWNTGTVPCYLPFSALCASVASLKKRNMPHMWSAEKDFFFLKNVINTTGVTGYINLDFLPTPSAYFCFNASGTGFQLLYLI